MYHEEHETPLEA